MSSLDPDDMIGKIFAIDLSSAEGAEAFRKLLEATGVIPEGQETRARKVTAAYCDSQMYIQDAMAKLWAIGMIIKLAGAPENDGQLPDGFVDEWDLNAIRLTIWKLYRASVLLINAVSPQDEDESYHQQKVLEGAEAWINEHVYKPTAVPLDFASHDSFKL